MTPSRTPSTDRRYQTLGERLLRLFGRDTGLFWKENEQAFFEWLFAYRDALRPASWRQYRAALAWFMENHPDGDPSMAMSIRGIPVLDPAVRQQVKGTARTSSSKPKRILRESFLELEDYILHKTYSSHYRLILPWLRATLLTGLRPVEWQGASILDEGPDHITLQVRNAKATNGRSFGPTRTLLLRPLSEQDILDIRTMVEIGQREDFDRIHVRTAKYLHRANTALWGAIRDQPIRGRNRRGGMGVTLYSARHQFAAEAKAHGLTKEEIAALMGHGSIKTATQHYGKRIFGRADRPTFWVTPLPENMKSVLAMNADALGTDDDVVASQDA